MYINRKIDIELEKWKAESKRKPLLVRGARQVGKTKTIREFGKKFEYFIEINFEETPVSSSHRFITGIGRQKTVTLKWIM